MSRTFPRSPFVAHLAALMLLAGFLVNSPARASTPTAPSTAAHPGGCTAGSAR